MGKTSNEIAERLIKEVPTSKLLEVDPNEIKKGFEAVRDGEKKDKEEFKADVADNYQAISPEEQANARAI